jgi:hypothetical protein
MVASKEMGRMEKKIPNRLMRISQTHCLDLEPAVAARV